MACDQWLGKVTVIQRQVLEAKKFLNMLQTV